MARAKLYRALLILIYLEVSAGQTNLANNQNYGVDDVMKLQQALSRQNILNNMNQIANGGFNTNLSQQPNFPQPNIVPANLQQSLNLPANSQQSASVPNNMQLTKQSFNQAYSGTCNNPSTAQTLTTMQSSNVGPKQNGLPQNMVSNLSQLSTSALADLAGLKGQQSLLSLLASQNNVPSQQTVSNQTPMQNQLTDIQKQYLVKALQSQSSPCMQPQVKLPCSNNQQNSYGDIGSWPNSIQAQLLMPQQPQPVTVMPMGTQPQYITVQAQPLTTYLQKQDTGIQQSVTPLKEDESSLYSLLLSELQAPNPEYSSYQSFAPQKKSLNLKSLIPLIIEILKEKKCGCKSCGCPNNEPSYTLPNPLMFSGFANQNNFSQVTEQSTTEKTVAKEVKNKSSSKDKKTKKKVVSEEESDENDSEYDDSSE